MELFRRANGGLHSTHKCNTSVSNHGIPKRFLGGMVAQAFSLSVIEAAHGLLDLFGRHLVQGHGLREELPPQPVAVLVRAPVATAVGTGEVAVDMPA